MIGKIIGSRVHLSEFDSLKVLGLVRRLLRDVAVHVQLFHFCDLGMTTHNGLPKPICIGRFLLHKNRQIITLQEVATSFPIPTIAVVARGLELATPDTVEVRVARLCGTDTVATPSPCARETRRLSCDHVDGVEAVRHRDDAVDAT